MHDTRVHYIARGLPSEPRPRRFAITPDDPSLWSRLGVEVIPFARGKRRPKFIALTQGVARWAEITRASSFWLEDRIIQILARPDPAAITKEEASLLEWSLSHDHTVGLFVTNARGLIWVEWLASRQRLAPYFDPGTRFGPTQKSLVAAWLADQLLAGPGEWSFEIVRRQGGRFSRELYRWLLNGLGDHPVSLAWVFLLAQEVSLDDAEAEYIFAAKLRSLAADNVSAFWALFRVLTGPRLRLERLGSSGSGSSCSACVTITGGWWGGLVGLAGGCPSPVARIRTTDARTAAGTTGASEGVGPRDRR